MKTLTLTADNLLGSFRTFGPEGPIYKIIGKAGEMKIRVLVIESGEEFDYAIERALQDPEAD